MSAFFITATRVRELIAAAIAGGGGGGVQSITAGTNVTLGGTAADPVINATGGSSYLVKGDPVVLIDAEIKALPTTTIEIVAAPGANKLALLAFVVLKGVFVNGYNEVTLNLKIAYDNNNGAAATDPMAVLTSFGNYINFSAVDNSNDLAANIINKNLCIASDEVVDYTGGDAGNTLTIIPYYIIVDL